MLNDFSLFVREVALAGFDHAWELRATVPKELPETVLEAQVIAQATRVYRRSLNLQAVANCIDPKGKL